MYVYLVAVEEGEYWQQWIRSSCTTCESFPQHDIVKHANFLSVTTTTTATMREGLLCNSDSTSTPTTPNPKSTPAHTHENRNRHTQESGSEEWVSVCLLCLHRQWMEEIRGEGQIRRSRKHRWRGLTRSQKLLSSPIDFFSTMHDNKHCTLHIPTTLVQIQGLGNDIRIWRPKLPQIFTLCMMADKFGHIMLNNRPNYDNSFPLSPYPRPPNIVTFTYSCPKCSWFLALSYNSRVREVFEALVANCR